MMRQDRGRLLLRVWPPLAHWQIALMALFGGTVMFLAFQGLRGHGAILFWMAYALIFAMPRPLRFYENGISATQPAGSIRMRFVPWGEWARYSLEGDQLVLTGAGSTLAGGPVEGGAFRLRPADRERVEQVLAHHLPSAKPAPIDIL